MNPRERCGHVSMARAEPAGHSAPMKKPRTARAMNRNMKVGARPAAKLHSE